MGKPAAIRNVGWKRRRACLEAGGLHGASGSRNMRQTRCPDAPSSAIANIARSSRRRGATSRPRRSDVSSAACVAKVQSEVGPVDILINNAGITRDMTFKKMAKADWDMVIHTNLDSAFNMAKQVCDGMIERGWGRIVNVSSVNGSKGAFGQTNYAAAKAGMHGVTKALALEVARKGVTVNTISPGYIGTKMVMAIPKEVLDSKILPQIPLGRLGEPEEIAGLIIYLCSDEAAFVTGANIAINGGQHMQ